jgi:hypothetical protein
MNIDKKNIKKVIIIFFVIVVTAILYWVFLSPCRWRPWTPYDDDGNCVTACPNGKYFSDKKCKIIPQGYICLNNDCHQCNDGEGVVNNTCELCKPGEYGQNGICYQCNINTTSNLGATSCTSCGNHKISNEDNSQCNSCISPYRRADGFENECVLEGECPEKGKHYLFVNENGEEYCKATTFVKNINKNNKYGREIGYYFCGPSDFSNKTIEEQKNITGGILLNSIDVTHPYGYNVMKRQQCIYDKSSNKWKITTTFIPQLSSENNIEHKCSNLILWSEDDINNALTGLTHDRNGVELTQEIKNKQKEKLRSCNYILHNISTIHRNYDIGSSINEITDIFTGKTYPKKNNNISNDIYRYELTTTRDDNFSVTNKFKVASSTYGLKRLSQDSNKLWTIDKGNVYDYSVQALIFDTIFSNKINSKTGQLEINSTILREKWIGIIDQRDPQTGPVRYIIKIASKFNIHKLMSIMGNFNITLRNKYNIENKNERTWEIIDATTKEPKTTFTSRDGNVVKENMVWPVTEDLYVLIQWIFDNFPLEGMTLEYYYSFIRQVLKLILQNEDYLY